MSRLRRSIEFANETACAEFLFDRRWHEGFVCPACGDGRAALLTSRAHTYEWRCHSNGLVTVDAAR
jgi:hypothetical protein